MVKDKNAYIFARIPVSVLLDTKLSRNDLIVYGVLASKLRGGNVVCIGQRLLALECTIQRRALRRSLDQLESQGHISAALHRMNRRMVYQINSPVFLSDQPVQGKAKLKLVPKAAKE